MNLLEKKVSIILVPEAQRKLFLFYFGKISNHLRSEMYFFVLKSLKSCNLILVVANRSYSRYPSFIFTAMYTKQNCYLPSIRGTFYQYFLCGIFVIVNQCYHYYSIMIPARYFDN